MATKFTDFMDEIEREAEASGPEAVEQLEVLRAHFRVGRQLCEARRDRKMTQMEVAKSAGVDQADVSTIERGAANPTFKTLNAVANAVGMEIGLSPRR